MSTFKGPPPNRFPRGQRFKPPVEDEHRINYKIFAKEVRVVLENGEQLGIIPTKQAIMKAEEMGLDLVEVAATAKPPVCKIMDYGKFRYREQKKEAQARKNRTEVETKELRLRYRTDVGDLETKIKHAREFLEEGNKVKFSMKFKGREAAYMSLGQEKFSQIVTRLADLAIVEERSSAIGNQLYILFAPSGQSKGKPS